MKRIFLLLPALFVATMLCAGTKNYTADETSIFPNPERGYYVEFDHVVTKSKPWCVKNRVSELKSYVNQDKLSLVLVLYYLDNYKDKATLPQEVLDGFDEDMATLRSMGLKAILRFAYTADDSGEIGYDAPLDIVQSHLAQYKSHWEENEDVIYCFQAGFIGSWGEWYYTSNYGNKVSTMNASRRALVDTLLRTVPVDRYVQIRTPLFKTGYIGDTNPLTAEEAYSGSARARIGHHNDAFLYGPTNMGTYADTATQKPYVAQEALYVPLGGETDITDKSKAEEWATRDKTVAEMSRMHWTFLQGYYSQTVTDMWRANGTFDELNRNMGYRFQLVNGTFSETVEQGQKLAVTLQIKNVGYAPLYNERHAYIVLMNATDSIALELDTDPRGWLPNGVVTTIEENLALPTTIPTGTYHLYLNLPDAYESLAHEPLYSVRFANEDVWDASNGLNDLLVEVKVDTYTPPTPPPYEGDAVLLPATLDKANVAQYSDDMTWFEEVYFNFGPEDAPNLERWAEWEVALMYPGEYIVSEESYCENGHSYLLELKDGETVVASFEALDTDHWGEGYQNYTQYEKWDLTSVEAGEYTLRVRNNTEWGQPKMKSLTLEYDGELPMELETIESTETTHQGYDLLGRPVNAGYQGIVVTKGRKSMQVR